MFRENNEQNSYSANGGVGTAAAAFDEGQIRAHVELLHRLAEPYRGEGVLVLVAFGEDPASGSKLPSKVQHFDIDDVDAKVAAVTVFERQHHMNAYVAPVVFRKGLPLGSRGTKEDILGVLALVQDHDADAERPARPVPNLPPNYVVETSSKPTQNRQAWLIPNRPLSVAEAEEFGAALHEAGGGDHGTKDPCHVWRVPGTLNWPNKRKLERGRPQEPQPVRVIQAWDGLRTDVDELRRVLEPHIRVRGTKGKANKGQANGAEKEDKPRSVEEIMARLPKDLRLLIQAPADPDEDRSKTAYHVITRLAAEHGLSGDDIRRVFEAHPQGIGARYAKRKDLEEDIRRCLEKTASGLLIVRIDPGDIAGAVRGTQAALIAAQQTVYIRGGRLVKPTWAEHKTADGSKTNVLVLKEMTTANLAVMTTECGRFTRFDRRRGRAAVIDPPQKVLQALLDHGEWDFPQVTGIINAPTLRHDGSILSESGYDEQTGLLHQADKDLGVSVPDTPTKEEALKALEDLQQLLEEYPFADEVDRSVALCAIMTVVTRGAYDIAPMFLFRAPAAGTGKSHLVDLVSLIARGRACPVITASGNEEEMEKRLGALLLEGAPILSIDNCTRDLAGDLLCQMVERPLVKVRILGRSSAPETQFRGTLLATGNNIGFSGDMVRRGLTCNLDAQEEAPEKREFKADPHATVRASRGKYIAAALTIAWAYRASGEKAQCCSLGSYGGWSTNAREPLVWLRLADPATSMDRARGEDPRRMATRELFKQVLDIFGEGEFTVKKLIECAMKNDGGWTELNHIYPDLNSVLVERCGGRTGRTIDPNRVGAWLKRLKSQVHVVEGTAFRLLLADPESTHGARWKLQRVDKGGG